MHGRQRVLERQQGRVDAHGHAFAAVNAAQPLGDGEELDHVAGVLRRRDVVRRDGADALALDVGQVERGVEGQLREDRTLGCGVVAFDVCRGVGFGVAEFLRGGERIGKLRAGGIHLVQDVVGGAVDDAHHLGDAVPRQRLADGPQQRDGAGNCGLEGKLDAGLVGRAYRSWPSVASSALLPVTTAAPLSMALQDERPRRFEAADQLNHDVGVLDQRLGLGGEQLARAVPRSRVAATSRTAIPVS